MKIISKDKIDLFAFSVKKTGNTASVYAEDFSSMAKSTEPCWGITAQWHSYPSRHDAKIWTKKAFPRACKKLARILSKKFERMAAITHDARLLTFNADGEVVEEEQLPFPVEVQNDSS